MRRYYSGQKPRDLAHEQFPNAYAEWNLDFVYGTGIYNDGVNTWLILSNDNKKAFCAIGKSHSYSRNIRAIHRA